MMKPRHWRAWKRCLNCPWSRRSAPKDALAPAPEGAGRTENLSHGGLSFSGDLQLLGDRRIERGKKILVDFQLPGEAVPVSAVAVVAWSIEGKGRARQVHGRPDVPVASPRMTWTRFSAILRRRRRGRLKPRPFTGG